MNEFSTLRKKAGLSVTATAQRLGVSLSSVYRWEKGRGGPRSAEIEIMRAAGLEHAACQSLEPGFRFIDLFAGIGGLRRGFEQVGGRCVWTSEWNKWSQKTYLANFPGDGHEIAGDITKVDESTIPDHDVLLAGFPCQPFSIAGVSKKNALGRLHGFRDEAQGTLFFDVARIIEARRPKAFLLENVKNLISHDRGRTFQVIRDILTRELGYEIDAKVIDARCFVPQHRERIFIVGFQREVSSSARGRFSFDGMTLPSSDQWPTLRSILHPEDGSEPIDEYNEPYIEGPKGRVRDKYTLTPNLWKYLQEYAEKHRVKGNGFGFGLVGPDQVARTLSARYHKDGSEILIRQSGRPPRRLTPRECARLMGFDVKGAAAMRISVSDTQAYRQFGNAVVVPVVTRIAEHMRPWIMDSLAARPIRKKKAA